MKPVSSILSSCSVALADAVLVALLLTAGPADGEAFLLLGVHVILAMLAALTLQIATPANAARAPLAYALFAFAIALLVPVLGPLGLQVVARAGLAARPQGEDDPWTTLELEEDPVIVVKRRGVSAAKIQSILGRRAPEEAERRFQMILQVKHLPPTQQIAVLKFALKDPSDEVRLFAFSRIEKFRSDLEARIKEFSSDLGEAPPEDQALLHLRLAETFHQIADLRLAEGAVLVHALEQAKAHAIASMERRPTSGPAVYLLGRILLLLGDYDGALESFRTAVRLRYPREKVIPHMAECAFRQRRFPVVQMMLEEMERVAGNGTVLQSVIELWR